MKLLAFDLEIAKPLPEGCTDWKAHRPLGISCAATLTSDSDISSALVWFDQNDDYSIAPQMSRKQAALLVRYLQEKTEEGYTIVSWNGLSFDFDVLAEESGEHAICRELALNHIDMMFLIFAVKGYRTGLNQVATGMGLPGKTEGVTGDQAPELWARGEYQTVLDYVANDVRCTMGVAQKALQINQVKWISTKGKPHNIKLKRWLTVSEALQLPLPDTSWMDNPAKREDMMKWTL